MIYIFTALYCEASFFINQFQLVKNPEPIRFQEFYNDTSGIRLTITGVGEIAAAAAVSSVCTKYPPKEADLLLNIGTCARRAGDEGVFLCNQIIEQATGKTFYPDILYRHDFREETVVTGMRCWDRTDDDAIDLVCPDGALYDMEAAAVYQAGSYFFGPHQMIFLKIVSDIGTASHVSAAQVGQLIETAGDRCCGLIERLLQISSSAYLPESHRMDAELEQLTDRLCADMHCSKVMGDSLRQYIRYFSLAGGDVSAAVQAMYAEGLLPCKDKREGKKCFEALKRRLFE